MKRKLIYGMLLICSLLAYTACQEKGEMQPPPKNVEKVFTYNVTLVYNTDWAPVEQKIDSVGICGFFGISLAEFKTSLAADGSNSGQVMYFAAKSDNSLDKTAHTANGNGHWFNATGGVCKWDVGKLYSEYQVPSWTFNIGSNPDNTAAGQSYTIRQAFWYAPDGVTRDIAINVFNVSIVAPPPK